MINERKSKKNRRTLSATGNTGGRQWKSKAQARQLWADNAEHEVFSFDDSGIDGIVVDEA
jgi:hypothetical protein